MSRCIYWIRIYDLCLWEPLEKFNISGAGIARGYLNQPELTEERFIFNPFEKDTKSRLYKTGDLASYLPEGEIKFLDVPISK